MTTPTLSHECFAPDAPSDILFLCDHATNIVPAFVGNLGLPAQEMERHIAWDPGAEGIAHALAKTFEASVIASRFSRLVIDPNRGADDPTLIMQLYDGTIIPRNAAISARDAAERREKLYDPYHYAINHWLDTRLAAGQTPKIISLHTFTPKLKGKPKRPWEIGVLYARDRRMADPLLTSLGEDKTLTIGDNQPYTGALIGDCMDQHGLQRGLPHILIEIRNDLITSASGQTLWADRLVPHLRRAIEALD